MSKRYRVVIQPEATESLVSAYLWMREVVPARADGWFNGIVRAIETLETFPARCAVAAESEFFHREIRQLLYGKKGRQYRVLFTIEGNEVHVLFIRHHAQDWLQPPVGDGE